MAIESVMTVIHRVLTESSYRDTFFRSPGEALAGYALTRDETKALKALERDRVLSVQGEMEARIQSAGALTEDLWKSYVAVTLSWQMCTHTLYCGT